MESKWRVPKIIDAVEAIPREERTPEMDSELQQAYSALNNQEKQELEHEIVPKIYADTGSLLSADDIAILESFNEGVTGYFGKMLQWLQDFVEAGVEEGRFTEKQAKEDLQIALWYAYACNNIDEYIYFIKRLTGCRNLKKCYRLWYLVLPLFGGTDVLWQA